MRSMGPAGRKGADRHENSCKAVRNGATKGWIPHFPVPCLLLPGFSAPCRRGQAGLGRGRQSMRLPPALQHQVPAEAALDP